MEEDWARELDAGAMSLYHSVANKNELLDAMVDIAFEEIELPTGERDWRAAMRQRALSARQVLARHPWATNLMESRTASRPANLATAKRSPRACAAGFSIEMATHANWTLDSYVYEFALQEASLPSLMRKSSRT